MVYYIPKKERGIEGTAAVRAGAPPHRYHCYNCVTCKMLHNMVLADNLSYLIL